MDKENIKKEKEPCTKSIKGQCKNYQEGRCLYYDLKIDDLTNNCDR